MAKEPDSLQSQAYEMIRERIIFADYTPGMKLGIKELCEELELGRTPVREALRRLLQEHLIEESGKGTVVMGISRKDFEDMCAIRLRIEGLAVRGFIEHKTEESMRELKEALDFQEFYLSRSDADHMKTMDGRFHETIYSHCGSAILRDTLSPLHKKVQKYRRLSIEQSGRAVKSVEEHRAIYNAIEAGDADLAEKLMAEHVNNAMHTIVDKEI